MVRLIDDVGLSNDIERVSSVMGIVRDGKMHAFFAAVNCCCGRL
jgi:hypothetical protein